MLSELDILHAAREIDARSVSGWRDKKPRVYLPSAEEVIRWRGRFAKGANPIAIDEQWPPLAGGASQRFGAPILPMVQNSATVINASATETSLHPSIPIPANYMVSCTQFRITVYGVYTSPASSPPTLTFTIRLGTNGSGGTVASDTSVAAGPAFQTIASQVSAWFRAEALVTCFQPTGQGLTVAEVGTGFALIGSSTVATTVQAQGIPNAAPATVAVASNAAIFLTLTGKFSVGTGATAVVWNYLLEDVGA